MVAGGIKVEIVQWIARNEGVEMRKLSSSSSKPVIDIGSIWQDQN